MLGDNFINILSDDKSGQYKLGFITKEFLQSVVDDLGQFFYLCGPHPMIDAVEKILDDLKVDKSLIVKEKF